MSDNTRRDAASTDLPHPARHPRPPQRLGAWPDARTAEVLLAGDGRCTPPGVPADRLVRLLAAARDGHAPLDPAREAAALAAFRTAAAGRAGKARGKARGRGRLAALRAAFAVRRPRVMAAAVVSALALGGMAVGMAAAARSFTSGEGSGSTPMGTRPPAAVSPDGSTSGPWTAGPGARGGGPAAPPPHSGAGEDRQGAGGRGYGHACHRAPVPRCPHGPATGKGGKPAKDTKAGQLALKSGGARGAAETAAAPGGPANRRRRSRDAAAVVRATRAPGSAHRHGRLEGDTSDGPCAVGSKADWSSAP